MNADKMMQPVQAQNLPAPTVEQLGGVMLQMEQLMQGMAGAISAMSQRMEQLERQMRQLTPITGAQETARSERGRKNCGKNTIFLQRPWG